MIDVFRRNYWLGKIAARYKELSVLEASPHGISREDTLKKRHAAQILERYGQGDLIGEAGTVAQKEAENQFRGPSRRAS